MKAALFAVLLLPAFGFTQGAMACSTIAKVSAAEPEHVFQPGDCVGSSNGRYALTMQADGVLTLSDERHPGHFVLWTAATGGPAVKGSRAVLKNDGGFAVSDPAGKELWRAPVHLPSETSPGYRGDFFLTVENSGRFEIYKGTSPFNLSSAVVWTSKGAVASVPDADGDCQCHITNSDGSPGHLSGEAFATCGFQVCLATCHAKKDYFGDTLMATYRNGSGKCKAF